jgi:hypothetical protein
MLLPSHRKWKKEAPTNDDDGTGDDDDNDGDMADTEQQLMDK